MTIEIIISKFQMYSFLILLRNYYMLILDSLWNN
jgi:hypothetical protein